MAAVQSLCEGGLSPKACQGSEESFEDARLTLLELKCRESFRTKHRRLL